jgi:hypothetical protein
MKTYRIVSALVVIAIISGVGYYLYQRQEARRAGIVSEQIVRDGDTWKVDFVVRLPATEKEVFDAIQNVEKSRPENTKSIKIVDQHVDSKTVDMELEGPAGMTIQTRVAFKYFPAEDRITYHTLNNQLLDTSAEYRLKNFEGATEIDYHQTTRMLQRLPIPDAAVRSIIRDLFIEQLSGLKHALGVSTEDDED